MDLVEVPFGNIELRATNETQNDLNNTCIKNPSVKALVANMVTIYAIFCPAKALVLLRFRKKSVTRLLRPNNEKITHPEMRISNSQEFSCNILSHPGTSDRLLYLVLDLLMVLENIPIWLVVLRI